ncbi:hypothetical protein [Gluconobacter sp. OJB]|uniref:ApeA N-terminal domain 1-containing protein n=1 Tax=Gluconobacter sp. OJB TaxID=3145196 RepID=UPI0031F7F54A
MTNKNNRGYFWIENESSKRTGTLTISEDHKVTVHVDGVLFNGELKSLQLSHDELNGYLFSSEYVKILDPYSLRGFGPREEDSHEIYFGSEYIKSNNDISEPQTYSRIRWKLTGLDRWLNISTYNLKKQNELNTFEIEYASDLSELNWETNTGTINILFEYNIHTNEDNLIFEKEFFLEIVFNENKTIKECFELSRIVERFFVTFVSRKHLVSYPSIYNEKNSESVIYYQTYNYDKGPGSEWLSSSFALIKNRFGYYLSNYIEMTPKYLAGFFGYPSSLSKGLFIQNKFSHLVTGLEVIHIQHYGLQKSPENKNDEILEFKSKIKECTKFRSDERRALRKSFEKNMNTI